jgi:hypothetical protein
MSARRPIDAAIAYAIERREEKRLRLVKRLRG